MSFSPQAVRLLQERPYLAAHARAMLDSFRALLGRDLIDPGMVGPQGNPQENLPHDLHNAMALYDAPFALLSHGTESDPILNFGNRIALELWERDFPAFTRTPSRLTAEPVLFEARKALLETVTRQGYIDNYSGVRISANGRRFEIAQAIVWNVSDHEGRALGQAATFNQWTLTPKVNVREQT